MAALDASPLPGPTGRPPANPRLLFYATVAALRDTSRWNDLYCFPTTHETATQTASTLYDGYVRRAPDGTFSNVIEAFLAIGCLDFPAPDPVDSPPSMRASGAPHRTWELGSPIRTRSRNGPPVSAVHHSG